MFVIIIIHLDLQKQTIREKRTSIMHISDY